MIGDYLYRLSPRDSEVTALDAVFELRQSAAASNLLQVTYTVPLQSVLVLKAVTYEMIAGAAQTLTEANCNVFPDIVTSSSEFSIDQVRGLAVAFLFRSALFLPDVLVPFGHTIKFTAIFNAGVAFNTLNASIAGILIPRGSITLGQLA